MQFLKSSFILILFISAFDAFATTRDFCFRAYTTGITDLTLEVDPNGQETATITDTLILQSPISANVSVISGSTNDREFTADIDNTWGYPSGGLQAHFSYEDNVSSLSGEFKIVGPFGPVAGGPFEAYLKNSADCIRANAPSNFGATAAFRSFTSTVEVDPNTITRMSRFNSGFGHAYTPNKECLSKVHYYETNTTGPNLDLQVPDAATEWRVWTIVWEDSLDDVTISFQSTAWPWLQVKIHHVFLNKVLGLGIGDVIPAGTTIGVARYGTSNATSFNTSVEFLNQSGKMEMASVFDLYSNPTIVSSYGAFSNAGQARSTAINPNNYVWTDFDRWNAAFPHPDFSGVPRINRCLGAFPSLLPGAFPVALPESFVMHLSEINGTVPVLNPAATPPFACNDYNLNDIGGSSPIGYCNVQESGDATFFDVH